MNPFSKIHRKLRSHFVSLQQEQKFRQNLAIIKELSDAANTSTKLIVDCGFNQGIVATRLLNALPGFSLAGFEVQQDIQHFAANVKASFPDRQIHVTYAAAGTTDGTIEYYEPSKWGKNYKGGTTTVGSKQSMAIDYSRPKTAPCVDLAKWLVAHVPAESFVFMKMDIEGAEYDVIEHLLVTGAIDRIDVLAVEWHAEKFPEPIRSRYAEIEARLRQYASGKALTVLDWY